MARKNTGSIRARSGSGQQALKMAASAVLGGATGAMVGGLLVRAGVKPAAAAVGVTVAGAVGASTMKGLGRIAAGGAAAAGAGQLALSWLVAQSRPTKTEPLALPAPKTASRNAGREGILDAFERAREQLDLEDEAAAYAEGYEVIDIDDDDVDAAA